MTTERAAAPGETSPLLSGEESLHCILEEQRKYWEDRFAAAHHAGDPVRMMIAWRHLYQCEVIIESLSQPSMGIEGLDSNVGMFPVDAYRVLT